MTERNEMTPGLWWSPTNGLIKREDGLCWLLTNGPLLEELPSDAEPLRVVPKGFAVIENLDSNIMDLSKEPPL